jgi:hypothetical protein
MAEVYCGILIKNTTGESPVGYVLLFVRVPFHVMLINHRTQQFLVLVFIVHSHYMFRPRSVAIFRCYVTKYILR